VVIYFHGGGWVLGSIEMSDPGLRALCTAAGVAVVSVDYPLAPEHPFPEALEACVESVRWARDRAADFAGDQHSLLVIGDSAGGNLAAATAIECARKGISLAGQVILYGPLVHFAHTGRAGVRDWSERDQRFGPTLASTRWYWDNYIKAPQGKTDDPRANPLLAENLEGVAPALIAYGTLDTYGEECLAYARLLDRAGIDVRVTEYPRLNHGYMVHGWLPEEDRSTLGYEAACQTYDDVRQLAYRQVA
jgi:acetyl esterase